MKFGVRVPVPELTKALLIAGFSSFRRRLAPAFAPVARGADPSRRDTQRAMPEESTTPDLVELFLRSVEAFNRRDLDAAMSIYSPDVVWDASIRDADRYESAAALRGFLEEWQALYEEYTLEVEEIADL